MTEATIVDSSISEPMDNAMITGDNTAMNTAVPLGPEEVVAEKKPYEYNAPQFYDFAQGSPGGVAHSDSWFGNFLNCC